MIRVHLNLRREIEEIGRRWRFGKKMGNFDVFDLEQLKIRQTSVLN
jgi:phage regulator Rha-like protein